MISSSVKETHSIAKKLLGNLPTNLLCLYGELGAGKTTFVQGLAKALGIKKRVLSPSFVLVREYSAARSQQPATSGQKPAARSQQDWKQATGNWQLLYHIDCYRLSSKDDLKSIDLKEFWSNPKNLVVIEWAERIKNILPKKRVDVRFEYMGGKKRRIMVNG